MVQRALGMSGTMPPEFQQFLETYGEPRTDIGLRGRRTHRYWLGWPRRPCKGPWRSGLSEALACTSGERVGVGRGTRA